MNETRFFQEVHDVAILQIWVLLRVFPGGGVLSVQRDNQHSLFITSRVKGHLLLKSNICVSCCLSCFMIALPFVVFGAPAGHWKSGVETFQTPWMKQVTEPEVQSKSIWAWKGHYTTIQCLNYHEAPGSLQYQVLTASVAAYSLDGFARQNFSSYLSASCPHVDFTIGPQFFPLPPNR